MNERGTNKPHTGLLRWIAAFKLVKATLMLAVGFGVLKLIGHDQAGTLDRLVSKLGVDPGRRIVDEGIGKLVNVPPNRLREVGFASFIYAALFFTEGIGLWLGKRWAEWFTVVITLSLVPLEIYEIHRHVTPGKVLVLLLNLAVVVYLVLRIRKEPARPAQG